MVNHTFNHMLISYDTADDMHEARDNIQSHATALDELFDITLRQKEKSLPRMYWIPKLHKTPYKARFIAGSRTCTTTKLSKLITNSLKLVRSHCNAYCKTILERTGVNSMWIINNPLDVLGTLDEKHFSLTKVSTWDFSTQVCHMLNSNFSCMIYWKEFLPPKEKASLPSIAITPSGRMIGSLGNTLTLLADSFALLLTFLSTISASGSETQFLGKLLVYQ